MSTDLMLPEEQRLAIESALHQSQIKIDLPVPVLAKLVFDRIATKAVQPTVLQVLDVIKTAVDMGLDPTSKDVYAFVNAAGVLTVAASKNGWEKAVELKGGSYSYQFGDPVVQPGMVSYIPWAKCTIRRKDGSVVEGIPAFFDECCGNSPIWQEKPKHMLMVRAFTNAAKGAYGFGAYSIEEAKEVFNSDDLPAPVHAVPEPISPAIAAVPPEALPNALSQEQARQKLEQAQTIEELRSAFTALDPANRRALRDFSVELANKLKDQKEDKE